MVAVIDPMAVTLRPMQADDLRAIMAIELVAYPFPWTEGIFRDCLRVGYCCWVAERADGIVAYAVMSVAASEAHLLNLCVALDVQRLGLGRRLLHHCIGLARQHGADTMFLEVRPSNAAALALYEQGGFVEVGLRRAYYPAANGRREDAVVLALAL